MYDKCYLRIPLYTHRDRSFWQEIGPKFIDWLIEWGFTLYRQYFGHIRAENLLKTSLPKIEKRCFPKIISNEIKPNKTCFNILLLTGIYIVGCFLVIVICIFVGGHTLLASRPHPKNKITGTGAQRSVCIHMIAIESRLLHNIVSWTEKN